MQGFEHRAWIEFHVVANADGRNDAAASPVTHSMHRQIDDRGQRLWTIQKEHEASQAKIDLGMCGVLSWEARNDAIAAGATATRRPLPDPVAVWA